MSDEIKFTLDEIIRDAEEVGKSYEGTQFTEFLSKEAHWRSNFGTVALLRLAMNNPQLATKSPHRRDRKTPVDGIRGNLFELIAQAILRGHMSNRENKS